MGEGSVMEARRGKSFSKVGGLRVKCCFESL